MTSILPNRFTMRLRALLALSLLVHAPGCGGSSGGRPDSGAGDGGADDGGADDGGADDAGSPDEGLTDGTPPEPGATGALTADNPTSSTVDLSWTAATDDTTAATSLQYRVYFAEDGALDTVANVLANGVAANDWTDDLGSLTVTGLTLGTDYGFNVVVRDAAGNMAVYGGATSATTDGAWGAEEPLEDYDAGSVYYSTLATNGRGDVLARWDRQPTWEAHYVTRPTDASEFGELLPWGTAGTYTARLGYDGDDSLASVTLRRNMDDSRDILFGEGTPSGGATFEEVALGIGGDYAFGRDVCVSATGDVMVVWDEGTSSTMRVIWARVRTGTSWGAPLLVSPSADIDVERPQLVCDPGGDHVVLYRDNQGSETALAQRVYDASSGAFMAAASTLSTDALNGSPAFGRSADGRAFVAVPEYADGTATSTIRVYTHDGSAWSAGVPLASRTTGSYGAVRLATAGDDVLVAWSDGAAIVGRRLVAGSSTWGAEETIEGSLSFAYLLSGDARGDFLAVWAASGSIYARISDGDDGQWGTTETLKDGGESVGSESLACILDVRRRATVVYTVWNPTESNFNAVARTYR
ncbi:MAG: fibronectin type III domain-containing protein [Sandaracinaceae bacterium]|nr:fibronectin type III domain-containing protein [Sandaracinaceae bacterium]